MRILFKAYFPNEKFLHFHQTNDHLLLKIFSTENYLNKISAHLFIDEKLANETLMYRLRKLFDNL